MLRTSRFFPEADDRDDVRAAFDDTNLKVSEFAYRRVDLTDVVEAHLLAAERAPRLGSPDHRFDRFVITATPPFTRDDAAELAVDAPAVLDRVLPDVAAEYRRRGWRMLPALDRVYSNERARTVLGWEPAYDIRAALELARTTGAVRSPLATVVGAKGYHSEPTGVYTT
ncbi:hypothetical protein [Saccharomonospora sp. CUA-673]|uniref:hypothetical protein n=1 Tax=Saccharomonospora sp. CUA-673 TaxID=1904969 RepID=UPI002101D34E|nr:hypothetical protein [Saccharomonospora sp. CUA-673]